jgi:hypothetical protein
MNRLAVVFAALLPFGLVLTTAPSAQAASAPATVAVPVVICPTTVGIPTSPAPVPASTKVSASAVHLTLYSTVSAGLQILGPAGFDCQGSLAVDGSSSITVWPETTRSGTIAKGGVSAAVYPACTGCMISFACPFFPSAKEQLQPGNPPCAAQPHDQLVHRLNAYAVAFSDPPRSRLPPAALGLVPSNSPDPTSGVVVFGSYLFKNYRPEIAFGAACLLPASERTICNTILDDFLASETSRFPGLTGT